MSQSGKDNLENFFRKRAQSYNPEFNEVDWLKLKVRLDNELPVSFSFWSSLRKFWYVIMLMIMIPFSWIAFSEFYKSNNNIQSISTSTARHIKAKDEYLKKEKNAGINRNSSAIKISDKPIISEEKIIREKGNIPSFSQENVSGQAISEMSINEDEKALVSDVPIENTNEMDYAVFENGAEFEGQILNFKLHFLDPIPPNFELDQGNIAVAPYVISKSAFVDNRKSKAYFSLGLGYSPDFSTVGLKNFSAPGSRWNVLAQFSFLRRWSINTGIVFVNNKYEAYGEDYHAPEKYWKNGIAASETYGECKMIDIPLNLRYDIVSKHRHKLFLSAGASTYFVTKEDYYFHYEQDNSYLPDHWGTEKMTRYLFGIINASMGYEYQVGKQSALQIEPFIKIPTTGIGWGNVDLHTIGTYFIYKYRIGK